MVDKQCASCNELNPEKSNFCSNCGASEFKEIPTGLSASLSTPSELRVSAAVHLAIGRVTLLSILSGGLYIFWWFYVTWKQLATETDEEHYPVWHGLSLGVPIYNLFRMHRHVSVINQLAVGARSTIFLTAGLAVVLWMVSSAVSFSSFRVDEPSALVAIAVLDTALTTTLIVMAQRTLNQYWQSAKGPNLREAQIGLGEVVFVLLGLLVWALTFVPA